MIFSSLPERIADLPKQYTPNRHTDPERSEGEVSKTREFNPQIRAMHQKRINKLDLTLRHCDFYNLDSCDLDSLLRTSCFAQNDNKIANNTITQHKG